MLRAAFNWLLIVFMALWFGVVMPGHQRGVVRLPGSGTFSGPMAGAPTCPMCVVLKKGDGSNPPADPARQCAICFLKGVLHLPPTVDFGPLTYFLIDELTPLAPETLASRDVLLTCLSRGPPSVQL